MPATKAQSRLTTRSQRQKATQQHHAANPPRRKWYHMTVTRLNADGTTTSTSQTASTKRVIKEARYTRRGKEIPFNDA